MSADRRSRRTHYTRVAARDYAGVQSNDVDGFYLNRRLWFLDGWINHCGYFPSWKLRLFRYRLGRHEQIEIDDNIALEITRYTNMCCSMAGRNIYRLEWSILTSPTLGLSSRSTTAIPFRRRPPLRSWSSDQVERRYEPDLLEQR